MVSAGGWDDVTTATVETADSEGAGDDAAGGAGATSVMVGDA